MTPICLHLWCQNVRLPEEARHWAWFSNVTGRLCHSKEISYSSKQEQFLTPHSSENTFLIPLFSARQYCVNKNERYTKACTELHDCQLIWANTEISFKLLRIITVIKRQLMNEIPWYYTTWEECHIIVTCIQYYLLSITFILWHWVQCHFH